MKGDIIDNYKELTIGRYLDILKIYREEGIEDIDRQARTIAVLTGRPEEEIYDLPIGEYMQYASRTEFLTKACDVAPNAAKEYRLGEWTLVPVTDHRKVITSQYIDFQNYARRGDEALVEILSCLLVPKGMKYTQGYDVMEVQSAIKENMSVADAVSLCAFFFVSFKESIKDSLTYCRRMARGLKNRRQRRVMESQIQELQTALQKGGDGLQM